MDEQNQSQIDSSTPQTPLEQVPDIEIPTLRTYKSDINQTVHKDKISTAKILIAEQNRERVTQAKNSDTSIKRPTNILVLILTIILIGGAVLGIGYFGYTKVIVKTFEPITVPPSFLFIFDQEKFVDTAQENSDIFKDVEKHFASAQQGKDQTYTDIVFYKTNPDTDERTRISVQEFLKIYDISFPTSIARSISKDFVYGLYKTENGVEPFLVVGVLDYEIAYSSMFTFESTLALDIRDLFPILKDLFDISKKKVAPVIEQQATTTATTTVAATTTATSTLIIRATSTLATTTIATSTLEVRATTSIEALDPEEAYQQKITYQNTVNRTIRFIDIVFSNKDARAVRDPNGKPFFYYAFLDKSKILFAQDPKILGDISRKIKEKSLVR